MPGFLLLLELFLLMAHKKHFSMVAAGGYSDEQIFCSYSDGRSSRPGEAQCSCPLL
jgi:hypothetical protein